MTTQVLEAFGSAPAKPIPAASIRDELADAIKELVQSGRIRPGDRDVVVMHKIGNHMAARGSPAPSERSFRRHLPRLRPLWRMPR